MGPKKSAGEKVNLPDEIIPLPNNESGKIPLASAKQTSKYPKDAVNKSGNPCPAFGQSDSRKCQLELAKKEPGSSSIVGLVPPNISDQKPVEKTNVSEKSLVERFIEMRTENELLKKRVQELEKTVHQLEISVGSLNEENVNMKSQIETIQSRDDASHRRADRHSEKIKALEMLVKGNKGLQENLPEGKSAQKKDAASQTDELPSTTINKKEFIHALEKEKAKRINKPSIYLISKTFYENGDEHWEAENALVASKEQYELWIDTLAIVFDYATKFYLSNNGHPEFGKFCESHVCYFCKGGCGSKKKCFRSKLFQKFLDAYNGGADKETLAKTTLEKMELLH